MLAPSTLIPVFTSGHISALRTRTAEQISCITSSMHTLFHYMVVAAAQRALNCAYVTIRLSDFTVQVYCVAQSEICREEVKQVLIG